MAGDERSIRRGPWPLDPATWGEPAQWVALFSWLAAAAAIGIWLPALAWTWYPIGSALVWRARGRRLLVIASWTVPLAAMLLVAQAGLPDPINRLVAWATGLAVLASMVLSARVESAWLRLLPRWVSGRTDLDDRTDRYVANTRAENRALDDLAAGRPREQVRVQFEAIRATIQPETEGDPAWRDVALAEIAWLDALAADLHEPATSPQNATAINALANQMHDAARRAFGVDSRTDPAITRSSDGEDPGPR